jgi:hypothetical protein
MNKTVIYFPDISGFTQFVTHTEIEHGQHIIASLLEEIIKSNYLNFSVSEIEGDSILFYQYNDKPDLNELLKLSIGIYQRFHIRRKQLNNSTECHCGACSSIKNLTLKFIIHFGEVKSIKIYKFEKLYGLDMIIAHRLLKNNIDNREYVLITNKMSTDFENKNDINGLDGPFLFSQQIEQIGMINGVYFTFNTSKNVS